MSPSPAPGSLRLLGVPLAAAVLLALFTVPRPSGAGVDDAAAAPAPSTSAAAPAPSTSAAAPAPSTSPLPVAPSPTPRVLLGDVLAAPSAELPDELRDALRRRNWDVAATRLARLEVVGDDAVSERAFLRGWVAIQQEQPELAAAELDRLRALGAVPSAYLPFVRGEILLATGHPDEAATAFEAVPPGVIPWARAQLRLATLATEAGDLERAKHLYEQVAARPDPAEGTAEALLRLGGLREGEARRQALRRVWWAYPRSEEAVEATRLLEADKPTWQEVGRRAESLMNARHYASAVVEASRRAGEVTGDDVEACRFRWAHGRSLFKRGEVTAGTRAFGDIATRCQELDQPWGAGALYLIADAQFKAGRYTSAAGTFEQLVQRYPDSTFADDALALGGVALQEAGDLAGAQVLWRRAVDAAPGDLTPDAGRRLALSLYQQGRSEEAVAVAARVGAMPLALDHESVAGGRYWAARLQLYPDPAAPSVASTRPGAREAAIAGWRELCVELPHSFYAVLAWARLREVAPDVAASVARRPSGHDVREIPWQVRLAFVEHPGLRSGVELARLSLLGDAMDAWGEAGTDDLDADEMALLTELRIDAGDWLFAHDAMRKWLKTHPAGTLGPRQGEVLRVAYPDRYWDLVQVACKGDRFDPRLFHALVREESNFNRTIVSRAGARGLSQLMPDTARQTAGWLRLSLTSMDQLDDPEINLEIGARYLDAVHKQLGDSPFLSLAAYNAGAGRVKQWLAAWGDVPTDELVERIPYKETRQYVKRVMGTWQTMRWQFDDGFYDLSAYNHHALPPTDP